MKKYKMGYVEGESQKELGENVVDHVGLRLPDDENIGRKVRFIQPTCEYEKKVLTIVCRQKCWGYDETGKYTMVDGYRGVQDENDFGKPFTLDKVEFVEHAHSYSIFVPATKC